MELFKLVCPACGADISLEKETNDCFCPYCGTKFKFDDGISRSEHTVYYRDEAKLRELELQEEARIRAEQEQIKEEKRKREAALRKEKAYHRWYLTIGIWIGLMVLFWLVAFILGRSGVTQTIPDKAISFIAILVVIWFLAPAVLPVFYPFKYNPKKRVVTWLKWSCILFAFALIVTRILSAVLPGQNKSETIFPNAVSQDFVQSANEAPIEVFNSPASENHLQGLHCYVEGKVLSQDSITLEDGILMDYIILDTANGEVVVSDVDSYGIKVVEANKELDSASYNIIHKMYEESYSRGLPPVGSQGKVYCVYSGFSDVLGKPSFYYGYPVSIQLEERPQE